MDYHNHLDHRIETCLIHCAKKYTDSEAIVEFDHIDAPPKKITYSALITQSNYFAQRLVSQKIRPGERVILISFNSIQSIIAIIGVWIAKGTVVFIDPDLSKEEIERQIKIADARFFISNDALNCQANAIIKSATVYQDCDENIAAIMFTSGSGGSVKPVMLSHHNFIYLMHAYQEKNLGKAGEVSLTILPLFHIAGLFCGIIEPLFLQIKIILLKKVETEILKKAFLCEKPNLFMTVPRLLEIIDFKMIKKISTYSVLKKILLNMLVKVNYFFEKYSDISFGKLFFKEIHNQFGGKLTTILCGSAHLSACIQKRFLSYGFNVLCAYGLTETCGPIAITDLKSCFKLNSVGRCLNANDLSILPDKEIIYCGPALMMGYFRDIAATQQAIKSGYFYTKDLGSLDRSKNLYINGRKDELIVFSDGKKVLLSNVEACYMHIDGIDDFAVFAEKNLYQDGIAFVFVAKKNADLQSIVQAVRTRSATLKPPFKINQIYHTSHIPRTNTFKIKRYQLHNLVKIKNIQTESAQKLIDLFEKFLPEKKGKISENSYFSELNIDSLLATQLCAEINMCFNTSMTPTVFWFYQNVAELDCYLKSEKTKQKNKVSQTRRDRIAIVAVDAFFPGNANNETMYWDNLLKKKDCIITVPAARWDAEQFYDAYTLAPGKINNKVGGFIDLPTHFDPSEFNIKPRIAASMDPQQKILLMRVKNLLSYDSKNTVESWRYSNTGLFIGAGFSDFMIQVAQSVPNDKINPYTGINSADFTLTARVAHCFGLMGPAMIIKTACSSSLVAVHSAVRALQSGDCDAAIAGGINLMLIPQMSICLTKGGFLSPDGKCKTFDKTANGYVRSEGCGLVLLKRLDDAKKAGDTVLATILGSAVNQDGPSHAIFAPNGQAQINCYQAALDEADIHPHQIGLIESHGTGTQLGDAIEMQSIQAVYDLDREKENTLYIGAVKSNIGHTESAAGIAGLIKSILALNQQWIPANLHFTNLNSHIHFKNSAIVLPNESFSLKNRQLKYAAVSSFGIAGTNAHMILSVDQNVEL